MRGWIVSLALGVITGCSGGVSTPTPDVPPPDYLSKEAMLDPASCEECHPAHFEEWAGSMHAYASLDPVFLAMNARGQRETNGELGKFCVQCHAPMALALGLTTDGLNLAELPSHVQGVTCIFCHTVASVEGAHNAQLTLADDLVMRGSYIDPVPNEAHASGYSALLDRKRIESANLCGSCHDIKTPKGVHLERTFAEWKDSLFSNEVPGQQQTCSDCHMKGRDDVAADYEGVFFRQVHSHRMVGVDTALTPFPDMEAQKKQIEKELKSAVLATLCVKENDEGQGVIAVGLENLAVGHAWPSGAAQDRRAWVEIQAFDFEGNVVYESGMVPEGVAMTSIEDPNRWRLGDRTFNEAGDEVHMFWDVDVVESDLLPAPTALNPWEPEWIDVHRRRAVVLDGPKPDRVTMRVRIRPMGLDVLDDLIESGDLDPVYRDGIPTYTLGFTNLEWYESEGLECVPEGHIDQAPSM
jgi:hypothetical protein